MDSLTINDNIFYTFKKNDNNFSNTIFVFVDIEGVLTASSVIAKMNHFVNNNNKFKKYIILKNNKPYWISKDFDIKNHVTVLELKKYDSKKHKKIVHKIINTKFKINEPMWRLYLITYEDRSMIILSCAHLLGDGYFLIENLRNSFLDEKNIIQKKNNNVNFNFNTILKYILNFICGLAILTYNVFFHKKKQIFNSIRNYEVCYKKLFVFNVKKLLKIKKQKNVSINTIIYSIILKTLHYYSKQNIDFVSTTLFNIRDDMNESNQFGFLCLKNKNTPNVFSDIDNVFLNIKESFLVPFIFKCLHLCSYISTELVVFIMNKGILNSHFSYSNIFSYMDYDTMDKYRVANISNIVTPYNYKILFSGFSYGNKINLNITYNKGVIDYKKFKKCFKKAIEQLL